MCRHGASYAARDRAVGDAIGEHQTGVALETVAKVVAVVVRTTGAVVFFELDDQTAARAHKCLEHRGQDEDAHAAKHQRKHTKKS